MRNFVKIVIIIIMILLVYVGLRFCLKKEKVQDEILTNRTDNNDIEENDNVIEENDNVLYQYQYKNYAWGESKTDFVIYKDGTFSYVRTYNEETTQKQGKIDSADFEKLKELADETEEQLEEDGQIFDAGTHKEVIYNANKDNWIALFDIMYGKIHRNRNEKAEEINQLITEIEKKLEIST